MNSSSVDTSLKGGGNSNNPTQNNIEKPIQISPSFKWCFTLNNYTDTEFNKIEKYFLENEYFYIIGEETGAVGTPHLQGFVSRKDNKKFRLTKVENICIRNGIKCLRCFRALGSIEENYKYCKKDNKYRTNMNKLFRDIYKPLEPNKKFMIEILNILKYDINDRDIYWYWGKQGLGKTWFIKYLVKNYGAILLGLRPNDNRNAILTYYNTNGYFPDLILINIGFDKDLNKVNYTMLEEIKDMCFYSGKYEGGMICGPNPNLIIFANGAPESDNKKLIVKNIL